jgi:hypothetical protein
VVATSLALGVTEPYHRASGRRLPEVRLANDEVID